MAGRAAHHATPGRDGPRLWERARDVFARLVRDWAGPVPAGDGLIAVLLQGAVTLADHCASAHVAFQRHMPAPFGFLGRIPGPYPHQRAAGTTAGPLVLIAPTGSGKTEAGLAWASRQLESMPGEPRLVWCCPTGRPSTPPVTASAPSLTPRPAVPSRTSVSCTPRRPRACWRAPWPTTAPPGPHDARKARARAGAMRLFAQRVRVATPHRVYLTRSRQFIETHVIGPETGHTEPHHLTLAHGRDHAQRTLNPRLRGCASEPYKESTGVRPGRLGVGRKCNAAVIVVNVRVGLAGRPGCYRPNALAFLQVGQRWGSADGLHWKGVFQLYAGREVTPTPCTGLGFGHQRLVFHTSSVSRPAA